MFYGVETILGNGKDNRFHWFTVTTLKTPTSFFFFSKTMTADHEMVLYFTLNLYYVPYIFYHRFLCTQAAGSLPPRFKDNRAITYESHEGEFCARIESDNLSLYITGTPLPPTLTRGEKKVPPLTTAAACRCTSEANKHRRNNQISSGDSLCLSFMVTAHRKQNRLGDNVISDTCVLCGRRQKARRRRANCSSGSSFSLHVNLLVQIHS